MIESFWIIFCVWAIDDGLRFSFIFCLDLKKLFWEVDSDICFIECWSNNSNTSNLIKIAICDKRTYGRAYAWKTLCRRCERSEAIQCIFLTKHRSGLLRWRSQRRKQVHIYQIKFFSCVGPEMKCGKKTFSILSTTITGA